MGVSHTERRLWALEAAQPKPCVLLPGLDCVPCEPRILQTQIRGTKDPLDIDQGNQGSPGHGSEEPRIPRTRIRGTKDPLDTDQGTINHNQPLPARAVVTEQKAQSMEQKQQ